MGKNYFTQVDGNLQLKIEHVFIEYERPILFLCKEEGKKEKYLCLCYECRRVQKWVIARVDDETICEMAYGDISIRQAFLNGDEWFLVEYDGEERSRKVLVEELLSDTEILPEEDVVIHQTWKAVS